MITSSTSGRKNSPGFDEFVSVCERVLELNRKGMKDEGYAKTVSEPEFAEALQELAQAVEMYKPLAEPGNDGPKVH